MMNEAWFAKDPEMNTRIFDLKWDLAVLWVKVTNLGASVR